MLAAAGFAPRPGPRGIVLHEDRATDRPDAVATALVHGGVPPTGLTVVREDLEAYFLRLVGARSPEGPGSPEPQERSGAR